MSDESLSSSGRVAAKYSKKSSAISKSSIKVNYPNTVSKFPLTFSNYCRAVIELFEDVGQGQLVVPSNHIVIGILLVMMGNLDVRFLRTHMLKH